MGITPSRPHSFRSKESNTLFKVAWAFRKQDADVLHVVSFKLNLLSYSLILIFPSFSLYRIGKVSYFSLSRLSQATGRSRYHNHQKVRNKILIFLSV
jgi:hypothetical protein